MFKHAQEPAKDIAKAVAQAQDAPKTDAPKTPVEALKHELDAKTKQAEEFLNSLKQSQADFQNYIKRSDKERKDVVELASARIVTKVLTVLDEFDHMIASINAQPNLPAEVSKGIQLVRANLFKILSDEGVTPIVCTGKASPYLHEVMLTEKKEGVEDDTILQELQKGYKLKDKVVRYAKVKVAKTGGKHETTQ